MTAHTIQAHVSPARVRRRIAQLRRGLKRAEDISEWNRLQAELQHLTIHQLQLVNAH